MKIVVTVLGAAIFFGLATVVGRIIYLANSPERQAAVAAAKAPQSGRLALPPQAVVRGMTMSGNRLAIHYEAPGGAGIAVLDTSTGALVSKVELVPEVPR